MSKFNTQYIETIREQGRQELLDFVDLLEHVIQNYESSWVYRRHQAKPDKHPRVLNVEELRAILTRTKDDQNALASAFAEEVVRYLNDRAKFEFFARLSPLRQKLQSAVKSYSKAHSLALLDERLKLILVNDEHQTYMERVEVEEHTDTVSRDEEQHVDLMRELQAQSDQLQRAQQVIDAAEEEVAQLRNVNATLQATTQDLTTRLQIAEETIAKAQPDNNKSYEDSIRVHQDEQIRQLRYDLATAKREIAQQQHVIQEQSTLLKTITAKFAALFELAPQIVGYIKKQFVRSHEKHQLALQVEDNIAAIEKDLKSAKNIEAPKDRRVSFVRQESGQSFRDILVTFEANSSGHFAVRPAVPTKVERAPGLPVRIQNSNLSPTHDPLPHTPLAAEPATPLTQKAEELFRNFDQDRRIPTPSADATTPVSSAPKRERSTPPVAVSPAVVTTPVSSAAQQARSTPPGAASPAVVTTPINTLLRQVASPPVGETPPQSDLARELKKKKSTLRKPEVIPAGNADNADDQPVSLGARVAAVMSKRRAVIQDSPTSSLNNTFN